MALRWSSSGRHRVLDFDIECRPLAWYGGDFVSKEVSAIAWKWVGERGGVHVRALGYETSEEMLSDFSQAYELADMVTGHYIRGYDLPTLNGAMMEFGLPALPSKLSQDTKLDLVSRQGVSASQENLAAMLGVQAPKVQMNQAKWRSANRLEPGGIDETVRRVAGDVRQHVELRRKLLDLGLLKPPVVWQSTAGRAAVYQP